MRSPLDLPPTTRVIEHARSYTQALCPGGPQFKAPKATTTFDPIPAYKQSVEKQIGASEATQTSTHQLTFQDTEEETPFSILPQALNIWRQARSCFVSSEKTKVRAAKLRDWANQGLIVEWAVGSCPTPPHFTIRDEAITNHFGEELRAQACHTMHIHAAGLQQDAELKQAQGQALHKSLENMYVDNQPELHKLTAIITRMVNKDVHYATTQMNKQEASMRAAPFSAQQIYKLRNPPPAPMDPTPRRERRRGSNQRSRSPRQRSGNARKRQRSRSNNRQRSQSRPRNQQRRDNRPNQKSDEQKMFSRFQQFLKQQRN